MADLITEMQDIMCRSCTECEANWCDGEDKQECRWMEKIAEVGQAVEKEIRNKAIDEFAERMSLEISESIIGGMLFDNRDNSSYDTADKIVDYVIDTAKKIAEQLKGGVFENE